MEWAIVVLVTIEAKRKYIQGLIEKGWEERVKSVWAKTSRW